MCSKLTIKTPERHWRRSGVFIVNFKHNSHLRPACLVSIKLLSEFNAKNEYFWRYYNHVWLNFPFTTTETKRETWYIQANERQLRKLENVGKISKLHRIMT